ncbi:MAG: DUF5343 domain-containing protein [Acidobacteriota bacterium]
MNRNPSVPYCTVKGFSRCLDILRESRPEIVDRKLLIERGLSQHAVYPVLGALRYLGLLNDEGRLTDSIEAFLDDTDIQGRREIVEKAYTDLLAVVTFPVGDREEIDSILKEQFDCASGVVAFCSTLFLWLAAEAGMPVARLGRSRRGRPPAYLSQLSEPARAYLLEQENELAQPSGSLPAAFERVEDRPAPAVVPMPQRRTATDDA